MVAPVSAFETRVAGNSNAAFSSISEEATFLSDILAGSDRITASTLGVSTEGRNIHQYVIGRLGINDPTAKRTVFISGGQHGDEISGREAALSLIRDLAYLDDAWVTDILSELKVVVIPTVNPDGRNANTRNNKAVPTQDTNRHHFACTCLESKYVQACLAEHAPLAGIDLHGANTSTTIPDIMLNPLNHDMIPAQLREAGQAAVDYINTQLQAGGYSTGFYDSENTITAQSLRHAMGLQGAISILCEDRLQGRTSEERWLGMQLMLKSWLTYLATNIADIEPLVVNTRALSASDDRARLTTYDWLNGQTVQIPRGYRLTSAQASTASTALSTHDVYSYPSGTDIIIPVGQHVGRLIPQIVDSAGDHEVVSGTRLTTLPIPLVRKENQNQSVSAVRVNGANATATFMPAIIQR